MTKQLPDEIKYGFVADRILRAVGDTTEDSDRYPDGVPAKGTITFTPVNDMVYTKDSPATRVEKAPIVCTIYQGDDPSSPHFNPKRAGLIVDPAGRVGTVALVEGHYIVSTQLEGRRTELKRFMIQVTDEYTQSKPLWLAKYVEQSPSPTIRFVVNEAVYEETLAARNQAMQAAERAEAPTAAMVQNVVGSKFAPIERDANAARSVANSASSRVDALEVLTETQPGNVDDATIALHASQAGSLSRDAISSVTLESSSNLFDLDQFVPGYIYPRGGGDLTTSSNYGISGWIRVIEGQPYTFDGQPVGVSNPILRVTLFNQNREWVSDVIPFEHGGLPLTYMIPSGVVWVRIAILIDAQYSIQMNTGDELLPYEPGGLGKLKPELLPEIHGKNIVAGSVSPEKTDFIVTSSNLFDLEEFVPGYLYPQGGGDMIASDTYGISGWIRVAAGQSYTFDGQPVGVSNPILRVTLFNQNQQWVSDVRPSEHGGLPLTYMIPSGVVWVRIAILIDAKKSIQMNAGDQLLPYEPGGLGKLKPELLPEIHGTHIAAGSVTPEKTDFIATSSNLIDVKEFRPGHLYREGSEEPEPTSLYGITGWIRVVEGQPYTYGGDPFVILRVTFFDEYRRFVANQSFPDGFPSTYPAPEGSVWARLSVDPYKVHTAQMNAGDELLLYEPGGMTLKKSFLPEHNQYKSGFILDTPINGIYRNPVDYPDMRDTIVGSTVDDVYSAYDDLVTAAPDYVTRTHLGDAHGLPLYRYDFAPHPTPNPIEGGATPIEIMIVGATHGSEKAGPWILQQFFDSLINHWRDDQTLEALRFNCHFTVIPVGNPSGYNDTTRWNRNGVDLNRNWPTGWSQGADGSNTYGGPSPLSEIETQLIEDVMTSSDTNGIFVDFHNFSSSSEIERFLWLPSNTMKNYEVNSAVLRRMDRVWKKDNPDLPQTPQVNLGYVSFGRSTGAMSLHATQQGFPLSVTFETCLTVHALDTAVEYDKSATDMGREAWVNYLAIAVDNLTR